MVQNNKLMPIHSNVGVAKEKHSMLLMFKAYVNMVPIIVFTDIERTIIGHTHPSGRLALSDVEFSKLIYVFNDVSLDVIKSNKVGYLNIVPYIDIKTELSIQVLPYNNNYLLVKDVCYGWGLLDSKGTLKHLQRRLYDKPFDVTYTNGVLLEKENIESIVGVSDTHIELMFKDDVIGYELFGGK